MAGFPKEMIGVVHLPLLKNNCNLRTQAKNSFLILNPNIMSWKKCPFGCLFEVADNDWSLKSKLPTFLCPKCHRISPSKNFIPAVNGGATQFVDTLHKTLVTGSPKETDTQVKARIKALIPTLRDNEVDNIYFRLVQLLSTAELNSNFKAKTIIDIFGLSEPDFLEPKEKVFKNMWELPVTDVKYATERDKGERQMFGEPIKEFDTNDLPDHKTRPVYVTLNVGNLIQGGAPPYGKSYFVFHDAVKLRCTFLATDSLQLIKANKPIKQESLATFAFLPKVLLEVTDDKLRTLCFMAGGPPPRMHVHDQFIEAHGWGQFSVAQDVKALIISEWELGEWLSDNPSTLEVDVPPSYHSLSVPQRMKAIEKLKEKLQTYCRDNNIELQFLNLNTETSRSVGVTRPKMVKT
jgi:hypothetical protein